MNRRELLKPIAALAAIPILADAKQVVGRAFAIDPAKRYVIFVDYDMVDIRDLLNNLGPFPEGTPVHAVIVPRDKTMDDAIRIFEVTP